MPNKVPLRRDMLARLRRTSAAAAARAGAHVCRRLGHIAAVRDSGHLGVYAAISRELCLDAVIQRALDRGAKVFFPRFNGAAGTYMMAQVLDPAREMVPGPMGIMEPNPDAPVLSESDKRRCLLWLVPGVAFDGHGRRLGRGGGQYDRLMAACNGLKVGIAHDWQIVPEIPAEEHDIQMDFVVTDRRLIEPEAKKETTGIGTGGITGRAMR